jgi:inhibitor of cysteine peptidase
MMKRILSILLLVWLMTGYAQSELSLDVSVREPSFVIYLEANPTTGFQWTVEQYDKNILTLSSSSYEKPNTKLIGAGGHMKFIFSLNKGKPFPEHTQLQFKYARSWEPKTATHQKVRVNFLR